MIEKNHKINSIQNTINNLIIYVDDIDAYFIIDKQNLPIDLRLGTEKQLKLSIFRLIVKSKDL